MPGGKRKERLDKSFINKIYSNKFGWVKSLPAAVASVESSGKLKVLGSLLFAARKLSAKQDKKHK